MLPSAPLLLYISVGTQQLKFTESIKTFNKPWQVTTEGSKHPSFTCIASLLGRPHMSELLATYVDILTSRLTNLI